MNITREERRAFRSPTVPAGHYALLLSLIDPDDPNDPIRLQVIPTASEHGAFTGMMDDPLDEDSHSPVPGLAHRYPDRVLFLVTTSARPTAATAPAAGSSATRART